jgi:hypothetical protein
VVVEKEEQISESKIDDREESTSCRGA